MYYCTGCETYSNDPGTCHGQPKRYIHRADGRLNKLEAVATAATAARKTGYSSLQLLLRLNQVLNALEE